jgi:hypothetical protein
MYKLAHFFLSKIEPELAHKLSILGLRAGLHPKIKLKDNDSLKQIIW